MKSKLALIAMTMTMTTTVEAGLNDVLASKSGSFPKYTKCSLSKGLGVLELNSRRKIYLSQSTKLTQSLERMSDLSEPAISGAGRIFHRWSNTQEDYNVRNQDGHLVTFQSTGFSNIQNNSAEAIELKNLMDQVCDNSLHDFNIIGEFDLDLKIGNRTFKDTLIIERTKTAFQDAQVKGKYIVPNAFESQLLSLDFKDGVFSFEIRVQEGDDDYQAIFEGALKANGQLSGKAFILPERKILGEFTGKKK